MVGARGFEPPTPCTQNRCATRLRHAPNHARFLTLISEIEKPYLRESRSAPPKALNHKAMLQGAPRKQGCAQHCLW